MFVFKKKHMLMYEKFIFKCIKIWNTEFIVENEMNESKEDN